MSAAGETAKAQQRGTARHGTAQCSVAWHGTARCSAAQRGTAQHGTVLSTMAWHETVPCSAGWGEHGMAWHGMARHGSCAHSQSPLEMRVSLRGDSVGSLGLTRSSTVTAAMALMLVEAVLGRRHAAALSPDAGSLRGVGRGGGGEAPFCREVWGPHGARGALSSPEGPAVGTGQEKPRHPRGRLEDVKDQVGHVLRGEKAASGGWQDPGGPQPPQRG